METKEDKIWRLERYRLREIEKQLNVAIYNQMLATKKKWSK